MSTFALRIATPLHDIFSGMVDYVSVNTPDGRAGFLRGALPRVAVLSEGLIDISVGDEKLSFYASDGIFMLSADGMTVVTSDCCDTSDIQDSDMPTEDNSARQYSYAKARIASALLKMKGAKFPEETF